MLRSCRSSYIISSDPSPLNQQGAIYEDGNGNVLHQNQPNPFIQSTRISYHLAETGNVKLKVYSSSGQEIATLVNAFQEEGPHSEVWITENLPVGVYIYVLKLDGIELMRKAIHLK